MNRYQEAVRLASAPWISFILPRKQLSSVHPLRHLRWGKDRCALIHQLSNYFVTMTLTQKHILHSPKNYLPHYDRYFLKFSILFYFISMYKLANIYFSRLTWEPLATYGCWELGMWQVWIEVCWKSKINPSFWKLSTKKVEYLLNNFILITCWNDNVLAILGEIKCH